MAMSPQRIPETESGVQQQITPETQAYLKQSDYVYHTDKGMPKHPTPSPPSTLMFDESWPSTDKPSTLSDGSKLEHSPSDHQSRHSPNTDDSIMSKYLRRFRNDPPLRREARKVPPLSEFWWGTKDTHSQNANHNNRLQGSDQNERNGGSRSGSGDSARATDNSSGDRDFEESSITTPKSQRSSSNAGKRIHFEPTTPKTKALIDRTNELLIQSDISADSVSSPPVSSEGVASSDTSSQSLNHRNMYHSTPEEEAVRPVLHRPARDNQLSRKQQSTQRWGTSAPSLDPENDILYQWRLKRRMEQAQEKVKQAEQQAKMQQLLPYHPAFTNRDVQSSRAVVKPHNTLARDLRRSPYIAPPPPPEVEPRDHLGSSRTTGQEKQIQTDAEIVQATTQTTPTVDPISLCTGPVTSLSTDALRSRISAAASPAKAPKSAHVITCCSGAVMHPPSERSAACCHQPSFHSVPDRNACHSCHCNHRTVNSVKRCHESSCNGCHGDDHGSGSAHCDAEAETQPVTPDNRHKTQSRAGFGPGRRKVRISNRGETAPPDISVTPITKAISQVVGQRLFQSNSSLDVSNVSASGSASEPEPLIQSSGTLGRRDESSEADHSLPAWNETELSDCDFSDDELLKSLRQKRAELLADMKAIDNELTVTKG